MVAVGDRVKVRIIGMTARGTGWGLVDNLPVLVPYSAVGGTYIVEIVEVHKEFAVGRAIKRLF